MPTPDYLCIGSLTLDRWATGSTPGGSVAYASLAAARLGLRAGMVTTAGGELDWQGFLPGIEIARWPSPISTAFENRYREGARIQRILSQAGLVPPAAVPEEWRRSPIVQLAPVAHEVRADLARLFPRSMICLTPQGLFRHWGPDGVVRAGRWIGDEELLARASVVILSDEDCAGDPGFLRRCRETVPVTVVTRGALGGTLYAAGEAAPFPAFPTTEVDPTGAGDCFAAAFMIEYYRTGRAGHSVAFASCAASFAVEAQGLAGIQDRSAVEHRLGLYHREFGASRDQGRVRG